MVHTCTCTALQLSISVLHVKGAVLRTLLHVLHIIMYITCEGFFMHVHAKGACIHEVQCLSVVTDDVLMILLAVSGVRVVSSQWEW